jgi:hypothetical protein
MTSVHPSPRSRLDERAMVSGISKPSARPAGPARGDCRNDHGVCSLLLYRGKCRFEILWARYLRDVELEPRCLGGRLILLYERLLPSIRLRSLDQQANVREARKEFSKEFQPLPGKRCGHVCEACDVASGPREAWHQISPTGSPAGAMTIGIVRVAFFAAWTAGVNSATITPTSRRTSSNASVQLQLGDRLSGESDSRL